MIEYEKLTEERLDLVAKATEIQMNSSDNMLNILRVLNKYNSNIDCIDMLNILEYMNSCREASRDLLRIVEKLA